MGSKNSLWLWLLPIYLHRHRYQSMHPLKLLGLHTALEMWAALQNQAGSWAGDALDAAEREQGSHVHTKAPPLAALGIQTAASVFSAYKTAQENLGAKIFCQPTVSLHWNKAPKASRVLLYSNNSFCWAFFIMLSHATGTNNAFCRVASTLHTPYCTQRAIKQIGVPPAS